MFYSLFLSSLILLTILFNLLFPVNVIAGRPLITDDTSTQGKGKCQLQLGAEYSRDHDDDIRINRTTLGLEFDYGIAENIDLMITSAYQAFQINNSGVTSSPEGINDTLVEIKWRFFENEKGLSFAIKPGIYAPTGDYTKGQGSGDTRLGSGETRYRFYFISTKEFKNTALHLNLGYLRNENRYDARENLWHASLAGEWRVTRKIKLVGNTGIDTNTDKNSVVDPVFFLGGFVYSLSDAIDIDLGVKRGLSSQAYDFSITGGISIKF